MDPKLLDIILERLNKMEAKIDTLLEFKWKIVGSTILASLVLTGLLQVAMILTNVK